MKEGVVFKKDKQCGRIWEDENGINFQYDEAYLESHVQNAGYWAVSRTLPLRKEVFTERSMIPFFDGLIPEGWLLEIAINNWKLDPRDRMTLLLTLCQDCIGDISVRK